MEECIFCKIVKGEIQSEKVYEDDYVIAIKDIHPQAPVHILIIPKKHIPSIHHITPDDRDLIGHMFYVAKLLAIKLGIAPDENMNGGYRLVLNTGRGADQSIFHIHLHLLGGRKFGWPPG